MSPFKPIPGIPDGRGEIYCQDASTPQTTHATPGTFDVITGWTTNSGLASRTTEDQANNKITCTDTGIFLVTFQASFEGFTGATYTVHLYVNGVTVPGAGCHRKLGATDVGSASFTGIFSITGGQDVDVRVACDQASKAFTPVDMQLVVHRIG